jgi:hypothetical protein
MKGFFEELESPEFREAAIKVFRLMDKEKRLLAEHGVDWHPYQG